MPQPTFDGKESQHAHRTVRTVTNRLWYQNLTRSIIELQAVVSSDTTKAHGCPGNGNRDPYFKNDTGCNASAVQIS